MKNILKRFYGFWFYQSAHKNIRRRIEQDIAKGHVNKKIKSNPKKALQRWDLLYRIQGPVLLGTAVFWVLVFWASQSVFHVSTTQNIWVPVVMFCLLIGSLFSLFIVAGYWGLWGYYEKWAPYALGAFRSTRYD